MQKPKENPMTVYQVQRRPFNRPELPMKNYGKPQHEMADAINILEHAEERNPGYTWGIAVNRKKVKGGNPIEKGVAVLHHYGPHYSGCPAGYGTAKAEA